MNDRLLRQLGFILEIDKEKNIFRQTHLSGHGRRENDAEHAWHMALCAYLLREYANEKVDIGKVMLMCLIHDLVEIEAGDTYAYDAESLKTRKAREEAAKVKLFSLLPEDQKNDLTALFDEFEAGNTPESRFAHAMDNLQPLLLNHSNGGSDWKEHQVNAQQVHERHRQTRFGSEKLYQLSFGILLEHIRKGDLPAKPLSEMTLEELWQLFPIVLREYDPEWKQWYADEEKLLRAQFGPSVRIRHIGSTAVPGMTAKPTVDILLEAAPESDPDQLIRIAQQCGYAVMSAKKERDFRLDLCKGYTPLGFAERVFHLHIRPFGDWDEPVFCEWLKTHPESAAEYVRLKKELRVRFEHDRDAYTAAKGEFIRGCVRQARNLKPQD